MATIVVIQARKENSTVFEIEEINVEAENPVIALEKAKQEAKKKWPKEKGYISYKADIKVK